MAKRSIEDIRKKLVKPELEIKESEPKDEVKKESEPKDEMKKELDLIELRSEVQKMIRDGLLARFHLSIYKIGDDGEFIIYQGVSSNVWARFSKRGFSFYRGALERAFERSGLITDPSQVIIRH